MTFIKKFKPLLKKSVELALHRVSYESTKID